MDKIRELLDKIEVLPMSPSVLPQLLPQLSDLNANFDEVVRIISVEQTLTAKLLQICNSAFFGLDEPVATVAEAVNRVGYQPIYLLAAMINGSNCFPSTPVNGFDAGIIWKHSVATAFNTSLAAESVGLNSSLAFTAGLMHDLGKVILAQSGKADASVLSKFQNSTTADSLKNETEIFGCDHAELGATLLERWKLPPELVIAVRHHHDPHHAGKFEALAACVAAGNFVTHGAKYPQVAEFVEAMKILKLDATEFTHWQKQFAESQDLISGMSKLPI